MKRYFLEKLSDINYRLSIHEGNANQRLASEARIIMLLPKIELLKRFQKDYEKLRNDIEKTISSTTSGFQPSKIKGIQNSTASKHIKLLADIQDYLEHTFKANK